MSSAEWTLRLARARVEPDEATRLELALARAVSWLLMPHLRKGTKPIQPGEIMPDWWDQRPKPGSVASLKEMVRQLAAMHPAKTPGK